MISRLSPVGLLRPTGAGLVAAVLFALPSCGATQPLPPATPAAPVHTTFQTGNGLLYPPELWGAVPESELARFLRWRVERALDAEAAGNLPVGAGIVLAGEVDRRQRTDRRRDGDD